jgi:ABC-2 type transport system ATP-binding protein
MITIHDLSITYGKKVIIKNMNYSFDLQKVHGIVGLNGAGKTTLLNTIFRIKKAQSGIITINAETLNRKQIGMLPTEPYFYSNITGTEHLGIYKNEKFELSKWNNLFKLPLKDLIETYSTGMKKKLALLSVIKQNKEIIILDEPYNGLDMETSNLLNTIIEELKKQGKTIIITSHILKTLTDVCDHLHYLTNKTIEISAEKTNFDTFEQKLISDIKNKNEDALKDLFGN